MSRLTPAETLRQVTATQTRPLRMLPASWWDEDVAVNMADWITRFVPERQRPFFTYGTQS